MKMHTSQLGIDLIKRFEGFRSQSYLCPAGVWTIGYGTTRIKGQPVRPGMRCTEQQAEEYLRDDLEYFEDAVQQLVKVPLNQFQFDALVSFTYNLGEGNLGKSTLLRKLNQKDYKGAADEFLRWNKSGGTVLGGLVRRRAAERDLFNTLT